MKIRQIKQAAHLNETTTARVIIVDPDQIYREGLRVCLRYGRCSIVGEARYPLDILARLSVLRPDLIVVGPHLVEYEALDLCRQISNNWPSIRTMILTPNADDYLFQVDAADAGVSACVHSHVEIEVCLLALARILTDRCMFPREIIATASIPIRLTEREREVLNLIAAGKTDREIADALDLAFRTVRKYSHGILTKFQANDRRQAVRRARRRGWI